MTSDAESITGSLCRTRQMMVQEVEWSASTPATVAESEYKGHKSLLGCTHGLLATMKRQDVIDRIIIVVGSLIFVMVVLYVVSKRIGVLTLQIKIVAAIKSCSIPNKNAIGNAVLNQGIPSPNINDEL